jgi:hypothetical protein
MIKPKDFIALVVVLAMVVATVFCWQSNQKMKADINQKNLESVVPNPYEGLGKTATTSDLLLLIKNIPIDKEAINKFTFTKDLSETAKQQTVMYATKTDINKIFTSYKSYLKAQKLKINSEINQDNYKYLSAGPANYMFTLNINKNQELGLNEVSVTANFLLLQSTPKNNAQ